MGLEKDVPNVSKESTNSTSEIVTLFASIFSFSTVALHFIHFTLYFMADESPDQDRSESTPLYGNVVDTGTLKLIIAFFFGFSITVTVALGIQLYYGPTQVCFIVRPR